MKLADKLSDRWTVSFQLQSDTMRKHYYSASDSHYFSALAHTDTTASYRVAKSFQEPLSQVAHKTLATTQSCRNAHDRRL
jgi:hypothetical protein